MNMKTFITGIFLLVGVNVFSQTATLLLENRIGQQRVDELIVLKRDFLEQKLGKIEAGKYVNVQLSKTKLVVQHDDRNHDGTWDEIAFLYSFAPKEKIELMLNQGDDLVPEIKKQAHVFLRKKGTDNKYGKPLDNESFKKHLPNDFSKQSTPDYQTEGVVWENDKVAFRNYFDTRNAKDIWGKVTSAIVMDTVGSTGDGFYHKFDARWGMDILKVGKSLGSGGIAVVVNHNGKDTIVRVGNSNIGKTQYRKIADGPVRAMFKIFYKDWNMLGDGNLVNASEEISIWGGQYFFENKVKLENAPQGAQIASGIVNLHSTKSDEFTTRKITTLYSFDKQSENGDELGMALQAKDTYSPKSETLRTTTGDVQNTYLLKLSADENNMFKYRFHAGWSKSDPRFTTDAGFKKYLEEQAEAFNNSIKYSWK